MFPILCLAGVLLLCLPGFLKLLVVPFAFLARVAVLLYMFRVVAPSVPLSFAEAVRLVVDEVRRWLARFRSRA